MGRQPEASFGRYALFGYSRKAVQLYKPFPRCWGTRGNQNDMQWKSSFFADGCECIRVLVGFCTVSCNESCSVSPTESDFDAVVSRKSEKQEHDSPPTAIAQRQWRELLQRRNELFPGVAIMCVILRSSISRHPGREILGG